MGVLAGSTLETVVAGTAFDTSTLRTPGQMHLPDSWQGNGLQRRHGQSSDCPQVHCLQISAKLALSRRHRSHTGLLQSQRTRVSPDGNAENWNKRPTWRGRQTHPTMSLSKPPSETQSPIPIVESVSIRFAPEATFDLLGGWRLQGSQETVQHAAVSNHAVVASVQAEL
jgi:hypothetical protein